MEQSWKAVSSTKTAPNVDGTGLERGVVHKNTQYVDGTPRNAQKPNTPNKLVAHNSLHISHFLILRAPHLQHGHLASASYIDSYAPQVEHEQKHPRLPSTVLQPSTFIIGYFCSVRTITGSLACNSSYSLFRSTVFFSSFSSV